MARRTPDITGSFGQTWELRLLPDNDHPACLAHWLVNVRGAHPFWEHWYVALIHLREIPNVPPAKKGYPEAEYEFLIASINPEESPEPDPDHTGGFPLMTPVDVCEQFHGVSDRDALRIAQAGIQAMMQGRISPDQDFRSMWHSLIWNTIDHFRQGKHPEN